MRLTKAFLFFILMAIVGVSIFALLSRKVPTPAELLKAEQEVYSTVLPDTRNAYSIEINKFQVVEYTSPGELKSNFPEDNTGLDADFVNKIPHLKQETWEDYQEKNKMSYPIKTYLPFTSEVILVNPSGAGISSGTNDTEFYWWVALSRIGFDSSLTQALVLVEDCMGESCYESKNAFMYSQGICMFLEKENEEWKIKYQERVWLTEAPAP